MALVDLAKKSNDAGFLNGVQRDLKESWLMPHYGSAFLKLHGPEIEKLQDHEGDDDEVVAEHQNQHENDGEVVVEH